VAGALLLAGCFGIEREGAANTIENDAPLKLCLFQHGIEPDSLISCVREAQNRDALKVCIPPEKHQVAEECYLEDQARQQESTHTTSCSPGLFGSVNCTTN
jgi:hypothetical protein